MAFLSSSVMTSAIAVHLLKPRVIIGKISDLISNPMHDLSYIELCCKPDVR